MTVEITMMMRMYSCKATLGQGQVSAKSYFLVSLLHLRNKLLKLC